MSYSYDFLQARLADRYDEAERRRTVAAVRRRSGPTRWTTLIRHSRRDGGLGGCKQ